MKLWVYLNNMGILFLRCIFKYLPVRGELPICQSVSENEIICLQFYTSGKWTNFPWICFWLCTFQILFIFQYAHIFLEQMQKACIHIVRTARCAPLCRKTEWTDTLGDRNFPVLFKNTVSVTHATIVYCFQTKCISNSISP